FLVAGAAAGGAAHPAAPLAPRGGRLAEPGAAGRARQGDGPGRRGARLGDVAGGELGVAEDEERRDQRLGALAQRRLGDRDRVPLDRDAAVEPRPLPPPPPPPLPPPRAP